MSKKNAKPDADKLVRGKFNCIKYRIVETITQRPSAYNVFTHTMTLTHCPHTLDDIKFWNLLAEHIKHNHHVNINAALVGVHYQPNGEKSKKVPRVTVAVSMSSNISILTQSMCKDTDLVWIIQRSTKDKNRFYCLYLYVLYICVIHTNAICVLVIKYKCYMCYTDKDLDDTKKTGMKKSETANQQTVLRYQTDMFKIKKRYNKLKAILYPEFFNNLSIKNDSILMRYATQMIKNEASGKKSWTLKTIK